MDHYLPRVPRWRPATYRGDGGNDGFRRSNCQFTDLTGRVETSPRTPRRSELCGGSGTGRAWVGMKIQIFQSVLMLGSHVILHGLVHDPLASGWNDEREIAIIVPRLPSHTTCDQGRTLREFTGWTPARRSRARSPNVKAQPSGRAQGAVINGTSTVVLVA